MITIDKKGWIPTATGIYWGPDSFGPFEPGQPKWIVLHGAAWTNGTAEVIGKSWAKVVEDGRHVGPATHLIIDKDGSIVQGISLLETAAGNCGAPDSPRAPYLPAGNLNFCTISIEHCKYDINNLDVLTPEQIVTSFHLIRTMCTLHSIPRKVVTIEDVSQGGIIRHADCDAKNRSNCPGPYPFADLQNYLNGGPMMFSNAACVQVWETYLPNKGNGASRTTGIFSEWRQQWINGQFKGAPTSGEYPYTLPNNSVSVAQNFGSNTCVWNNGTPVWL